MLARYLRGTCRHRVSVCLSVCLSQVAVLLKRLNLGSHKRRCLLMPKISAKFQMGHPQQGRQIEMKYV